MITVSHLTKYYGDYLAVDDLSFEIEQGHVYGFLGPNGAGKSTTMNIMTGCLSATEGSVIVDGHDIFEEPEQAKRCIGYLPEQPPLYMNETAMDYLRFVAEAKGLRGAVLKEQVNTVLEKTGITHVRNKRISDLSKGYKQRVGIAQALLGNPEVIILDEPTVGLDPLQIIEIRELIRTLGQTHTVIFSSHILSEVQALCDQVLIIAGGKLVAFDEPQNLERQLSARGEIRVTANILPEEGIRALSELPHVSSVGAKAGENGYVCFCVQADTSDIYTVSTAIFRTFVDKGWTLAELALHRVNLEDIFLELTENTAVNEEQINEKEEKAQ